MKKGFWKHFLLLNSMLFLAFSVAAAQQGALVHLFEWQWEDVAKECETFLGPNGFAGVQISPPNEHRIVPGRPWWERYQPVSYKLESRSGSRQQFIDMVDRCKKAGVKIYADAVVNHMASLRFDNDPTYGVGTGGSHYDYYSYPDFHHEEHFHHCRDDIRDYQDRWRVQNCNLCGLADLNTRDPYVQHKIASYLNELLGLGVSGFRIDAAKHMAVEDITGFLSQVHGNPEVYQEVIETAGEPIQGTEYLQNGKISEFDYGKKLSQVFREGKLASLKTFTQADPLFLPSDEAIVFIDNHDNQRGHGNGARVLTHKEPALYTLANLFMLAWPYGTPLVMSSYTFTNTDSGPPYMQSGDHRVHQGEKINCGTEWQCEHRWVPVANMVAFRNATEGTPVLNWWDNGNNQIAFSRGDKGFVAINRESFPLVERLKTNLAPGEYCNAWNGALKAGKCAGSLLQVDPEGFVTLAAQPDTAVILFERYIR